MPETNLPAGDIGRRPLSDNGFLTFDLDKELRYAILDPESSGLSICYQPIVGFDERRVEAVEALARWNHPLLGAISPTAFVGAAESSGLIYELGDLLTAMAISNFPASDLQNSQLDLAVNVSAIEMGRSGTADRILEKLAVNGFPPERFVVELTETAMVFEDVKVQKEMHRLRAAGVTLSVDDFGTGHASFDYITKFPVHSIKIDRMFIKGADEDTAVRRIFNSMVSVGVERELKVVAEGIETMAELKIAQDADCDGGQGFLFGGATAGTELMELPDLVHPSFCMGSLEYDLDELEARQ